MRKVKHNYFSGKTVVITGSTGFIGQRLLFQLQNETEANIVLVSRSRPNGIDSTKVTWIQSPLESLSPCKFIEAGVTKVDIVFHLAAYIPKVHTDSNNVDIIYRANILGTKMLLEALPDSINKFVFSSTIDVYALAGYDQVLDERSALAPTSLYGASKLFCEYLISTIARQRSFGCSILRYGHIYGPGEGAYAKLIPVTIRNLFRGKQPVLYGDGSALRDFLYVDDVVEATLRAAVNPSTQMGPLNIVRGESVSIANIVTVLTKIIRYNGDVCYLRDKPTGASFRFDNRAMLSVLGEWKFMTLRDGLEREVTYFMDLES